MPRHPPLRKADFKKIGKEGKEAERSIFIVQPEELELHTSEEKKNRKLDVTSQWQRHSQLEPRKLCSQDSDDLWGFGFTSQISFRVPSGAMLEELENTTMTRGSGSSGKRRKGGWTDGERGLLRGWREAEKNSQKLMRFYHTRLIYEEL